MQLWLLEQRVVLELSQELKSKAGKAHALALVFLETKQLLDNTVAKLNGNSRKDSDENLQILSYCVFDVLNNWKENLEDLLVKFYAKKTPASRKMKFWKTLVADDLNDTLIECGIQPAVKSNLKSVGVLYFCQKILKEENSSAEFFKISRLIHQLMVNNGLAGKEAVEVNEQDLAHLASLCDFRPFV